MRLYEATILLAVGAILCSVLPPASCQSPLPGCAWVQTDTAYNQEFIDSLPDVHDGYMLALSTGNGYWCQRLQFYSNKTFQYSYLDTAGVEARHTGTYSTGTPTLAEPGYILLAGLPPGELGAGLDTISRMGVIRASKVALVVKSCAVAGPLYTEQVYAFIPYGVSLENGNGAAETLKKDLVEKGVPLKDRLVKVEQTCPPSVRGPPDILQIYRFLAKIGLIPTIPFVRAQHNRGSVTPPQPNVIPEQPTPETLPTAPEDDPQPPTEATDTDQGSSPPDDVIQPDGDTPEMQPDAATPEIQPGGDTPEMQPDAGAPEMQPGGDTPEMQPDVDTPGMVPIPGESNPEPPSGDATFGSSLGIVSPMSQSEMLAALSGFSTNRFRSGGPSLFDLENFGAPHAGAPILSPAFQNSQPSPSFSSPSGLLHNSYPLSQSQASQQQVVGYQSFGNPNTQTYPVAGYNYAQAQPQADAGFQNFASAPLATAPTSNGNDYIQTGFLGNNIYNRFYDGK